MTTRSGLVLGELFGAAVLYRPSGNNNLHKSKETPTRDNRSFQLKYYIRNA